MVTSVRIPLGDERLHLIGELLTNKTAVRLLGVLAEDSLSTSELAEKTGIPLSTVDYTLKKIRAAGLVVETGRWWSSKGKSVPRYTIADKDITISPRPLLKGILPALLGSGLVAVLIRLSTVGRSSGVSESIVSDTSSTLVKSAALAQDSFSSAMVQPGAGLVVPDVALWFLLGSLVGIALLASWHLFIQRMKGGVL